MIRPATALLVLLVGAPAAAQAPTATVVGIVRDASGAVVVGAAVRVISADTGIRRVLATNDRGSYEASFLPPGRYRIEAESTGFKTAVRDELVLEVNQRAAVDFALEVGDVTEQILVPAEPPALDTQNATVGTVVNRQMLVGLPLNNRDLFQLATLIPGSVPPAEGSQNATQGGAVSINGVREQSNNFLIDGIDNNAPIINQISMPLSIDALDQFKVQTSTYGAEFGRSGGGQINYVTKSGSNLWQGSAYEYFRDSALDSRNFFDLPDRDTPRFRRNIFGLSVGGPLRTGETFVFGHYEGLRNRQAFTRVATVPPTAWINGDFSSMLTGRIDPTTGLDVGQLFDPRTSVPIPGNVIPPGLQDPAGRAMLDFYPAPDDPDALGPANATVSPVGDASLDQTTARVDQVIGSGQRLFTRFSFWNEHRFNAFDPLTDPTNVPGFGSVTGNRAQNLGAGWTATLGSAVNEFRFGFNRHTLTLDQEHQGTDISHQLGIMGLSTDPLYVGRPGVVLGITDALEEPTNTPQEETDTTYHVSEAYSWLAGRHSLKTGVEARHVTMKGFLAVNARGEMIFSGRSGNPVADLLLGVPTVAIAMSPEIGATNISWTTGSLAAYFQDDWRAHDDLTLTFGLRYEYNVPPRAEITLMLPDVFNEHGGGLVEFGTEGVPKAGYEGDKNNFAPRIGLAWTPGASRRTVVRGGYGIYYDVMLGNAPAMIGFNPPAFELGFYFAPTSLATAYTGPAAPITSATWIDPALRDAHYHHWSVGVQHELLPRTVVDVSYVGSAGRNLIQQIAANQGPAGGPPFRNPEFSSVPGLTSRGRSSYHSMQIRVERRFHDGLALLSAYTWSRSRDTGSAFFGSRAGDNVPQDSTDLDAEWGPSDFDTPHRYVLSGLWQLPFGPDRQFLNEGGVPAAVVGDWDLAFVATVQSGRPFTVFYGPAANYSGTSNGANGGPGFDRPNQVGDPSVFNPTYEQWFDPDAFEPPNGEFGSVGRNTLRGDAYSSVDLGFYRNVDLGERASIQFRIEVFNLFNTTNFFLPEGDLTSARAGQITSAADGRKVQLGFRIRY